MILPRFLIDLIAAVGIGVGVFLCLTYTERTRRTTFRILGFVIGYIMFGLLAIMLQIYYDAVVVVISIIGGLIFSKILVKHRYFAVFVFGAVFGLFMIMHHEEAQQFSNKMVLIWVVIAGFIAMGGHELIEMLLNSFVGSFFVVTGIYYFKLNLPGIKTVEDAYIITWELNWEDIIGYWFLLGLFSMLPQYLWYRFTRKAEERDDEG